MREDPRIEGLRWLEQAQADWEWTQHLFEHGAYYLVCFLAQQVAEKALKAFLYAQGKKSSLAMRYGNYVTERRGTTRSFKIGWTSGAFWTVTIFRLVTRTGCQMTYRHGCITVEQAKER